MAAASEIFLYAVVFVIGLVAGRFSMAVQYSLGKRGPGKKS